MEKFIKINDFATIIFQSFNFNFVDINISILDIMNSFCWVSSEGYSQVFSAIMNYKIMYKFKSHFEPFVNILKNSKNIIMIENITTFVNTLIESPLESEKRVLYRAELINVGIKHVYEVR